jgi:hypothetical protein
MRMRDPSSPITEELHDWAYDALAKHPTGDWELVLSWRMERGLLGRCVEYAADPECPNAQFFLDVLYQWVDTVATNKQFEVLKSLYDEWLEVARGTNDAKVKRWRHRARLVFQGIEPYDRERWQTSWFADR